MRICSVLISVLLLIVGAKTMKAQDTDGYLPNIYQINASTCQHTSGGSLTGFLVKGISVGDKQFDGIVTALHGVVGCDPINATASGVSNMSANKKIENLQLIAVDIEHDVALLIPKESSELIDKTEGLKLGDHQVEPSEAVYVIGHPYGRSDQVKSENMHLRGHPLIALRNIVKVNILAESVQKAIESRKSPDIEIEVLEIEGTLVPGHSGAPVFNSQNQVIGVGNGGLKGGSTEFSWAIPWGEICWTEVKADSSDPIGNCPNSEQTQERLIQLNGKNPDEVFVSSQSSNIELPEGWLRLEVTVSQGKKTPIILTQPVSGKEQASYRLPLPPGVNLDGAGIIIQRSPDQEVLATGQVSSDGSGLQSSNTSYEFSVVERAESLILTVLPLNPPESSAFTIRGRLIDGETRNPVADATVTVSENYNGTLVPIRSIPTDGTGSYVLTGIDAAYNGKDGAITVEAEGYGGSIRNTRLGPIPLPDILLTLDTVAVPDGASVVIVSNVFNSETSAPIRGATVAVNLNFGAFQLPLPPGTTDNKGNYTLPVFIPMMVNQYGTLSIEAEGFQTYKQNVLLRRTLLLDISLLPAAAPTPTPTYTPVPPTFTPTPNATATAQAISPTSTPTPTSTKAQVSELYISQELEDEVYYIKGTDISKYKVGDSLRVYNELSPGISIGKLRVVGIDSDALYAQVIFVHPDHKTHPAYKISANMRVDTKVDSFFMSKLVPAYKEAVGFIDSPEWVVLDPNDDVKLETDLEAIQTRLRGSKIVDYIAFNPPMRMRVKSIGFGKNLANVALPTGDARDWPPSETIVIVAPESPLPLEIPTPTSTPVPTVTNDANQTPIPIDVVTSTPTPTASPQPLATPRANVTETPTNVYIMPVASTPTLLSPTATATIVATETPTMVPTRKGPLLTAGVQIDLQNANQVTLANNLYQSTGNWAMEVAYSPDNRTFGQFLDGTGLILYDATNYEQLATVNISGNDFVFSSDGRWATVIRYAFGDGNKITERSRTQFFDVSTYMAGSPVGNFPFVAFEEESSLSDVAASPVNPNLVAVGGFKGAPVHLIELSDSPQSSILRHFEDGAVLFSLDFSPDGQTLALLLSNTIELWSIPEQTLIHTVQVDQGWIVRFLSDGSKVAVTSNSGVTENSIVIYNVSDWSVSGVLSGHSDRIRDLDFSSDGSLLVSASDDETIRIWDVANNSLVKTLQHTGKAKSVAFSNDERTIASAGTEGVFLWGIQKPSYQLSGVVQTDQEVRLQGVNVAIYQWQDGQQQRIQDVVTDASGHFMAEVANIGDWFIEPNPRNGPIWSEDRMNGYIVGSRSIKVTVPANQEILFEYKRADYLISGRVLYADGSPVAGLFVDGIGTEGKYGSSYPYSLALTDSNGDFQLSVDPGEWKVRSYECNPVCRIAEDILITIPPSASDVELIIPP